MAIVNWKPWMTQHGSKHNLFFYIHCNLFKQKIVPKITKNLRNILTICWINRKLLVNEASIFFQLQNVNLFAFSLFHKVVYGIKLWICFDHIFMKLWCKLPFELRVIACFYYNNDTYHRKVIKPKQAKKKLYLFSAWLLHQSKIDFPTSRKWHKSASRSKCRCEGKQCDFFFHFGAK